MARKKHKKGGHPPSGRPAAQGGQPKPGAPPARQAEASEPPGPRTLQQQRAAYALEAVTRARDEGVDRSEFRSRASGFPAMVQTNGLGQAAAFYRSQGKRGDAYHRLYGILSEWLACSGQPYEGLGLLEGITSSDMHRYRVAQAEALLLLDWVKKFAKAFMSDDDELEEAEAVTNPARPGASA